MITVKYNSVALDPTPIVNKNNEPIDLNHGRWGNIETIELKGFLTGILSTGDYSRITNVFTGNFSTLEVSNGANILYSWDKITVEDIDFDSSRWSLGGFTTYTVKLRKVNVPSGVTDIGNEYAFTQNEDGTVSVNHRISAKGINTDVGALENAVAFVNQFTGKNPFTHCVPTFIPSGNGIMMSITENIDRLTQTYTVQETYRYTTGFAGSHYEVVTCNVDESPNKDYVTIDFNGKYQASPVDGNLSTLQTTVSSKNFLTELSSKFGITTTNLIKSSVSINQDSAAKAIDVKLSYISGLTNDATGYFDCTIGTEEDYINQKNTWKIDGEFVVRGPVAYKIQQCAAFRTATLAIFTNFENFLYQKVLGSPTYVAFKDFDIVFPPINFSISENTGLGTLRLSATFGDVDNPLNLANGRCEVNFEPARWVYDLLPASNIEGHYVVQDLQVKTSPKISYSLSAAASGTPSGVQGVLESVSSTLSGAYVVSGFVIQESYLTGYNEVSVEKQFICDNILDSDNLSNYRVHGSFATIYTRPAGYKFGY